MTLLDRYYQHHEGIEGAVRRNDLATAARLAKDTIPLFPDLVRDTKLQFGAFDISESVAVHTGARVLAALGDVEGLRRMRNVLASVPELRDWAGFVSDRLADAELGSRITEWVQANPGCGQASLKSRLGVKDGRRVANVCGWLERAGRILRRKAGKSYELHIP